MKERITITLDSDLLKTLDERVDGFEIKNRSHAIELLVSKTLRPQMPEIALIMAAGKIKRIKTKKGMLPVKMAEINNKPVLLHIIELFKRHGIREIFIANCYDKKLVKDYFGDGSRLGLSIHYIDEDDPTGTTSLLYKIKPYVNGPFFVSNADELKDLDLADMYAFHKSHDALCTIALTTVDDPSRYGVVNMDGNYIKSFTEKPKSTSSSSKIINSGLYLFNPNVFEDIRKGSRMLYDFLPDLVKKNKLFGYIFSGYWFDLSTQQLFDKASKSWKYIRQQKDNALDNKNPWHGIIENRGKLFK